MGVEEMAPAFSITTTTNNIPIGMQRKATVLFTVTNTSTQPLTGRAVLVMDPPNDSHSDWLALKPPEESERQFPVDGIETYTVEVNVPVEAVPGEYIFHLDTLDTEDPDETYTVGPTVKLEVAAPPPPLKKKPFPLWIVLAALGALAVIGVILFLIFRPRPPMIVYDLVASANKAYWESGAGGLPWPGSEVDDRGFAINRDGFRMEDGLIHGLTLETHPQWVPGGFIDGAFTDIYSSGYTVASNDTFVAVVGFLENANAGEVTFKVMIRAQGSENQWIGQVTDTYDSQLKEMRIPLAPWAGRRADFILWVDAGASSGQDWATWVIARIERQ
jgi:hypothetical protein